jgi:hypothetical protein
MTSLVKSGSGEERTWGREKDNKNNKDTWDSRGEKEVNDATDNPHDNRHPWTRCNRSLEV